MLQRGLLYGELLVCEGAIGDPGSAALIWELCGDLHAVTGDGAAAADCFSRAESLYRLPDAIGSGLGEGQEDDLGVMLEMLYEGRYPVYDPFQWPKESHVERIVAKAAAARDGGLREVASAAFAARPSEPSEGREPVRLALVNSPSWGNASRLFDAETDGSTSQARIRGRWRIAVGRSMGAPALAALYESASSVRAIVEGAAMALLGILELQHAGDNDLAEVEAAILLADCRAYMDQVAVGTTAVSPVNEVMGDCLLVTGDYEAATAQYGEALAVAAHYTLADSNLLVLDRLTADLLGDDGFTRDESGMIARVEAKRDWCAERS